jgi:hypothetical protein
MMLTGNRYLVRTDATDATDGHNLECHTRHRCGQRNVIVSTRVPGYAYCYLPMVHEQGACTYCGLPWFLRKDRKASKTVDPGRTYPGTGQPDMCSKVSISSYFAGMVGIDRELTEFFLPSDATRCGKEAPKSARQG